MSIFFLIGSLISLSFGLLGYFLKEKERNRQIKNDDFYYELYNLFDQKSPDEIKCLVEYKGSRKKGERIKYIYSNIRKSHGKKVLTLDFIADYFINLQKTKLKKKFNSFGEYVDDLKQKGYRFL